VRKLLFSVDSSMYNAIKMIAEDNIQFEKIGDRTPKLIVGGVGVSGNAFVDNADKRIWLAKNFNALITDRESSAVAQVSVVNGIPFIVFRSASDLAGGSGPSSARGELEEFSKIAAINSSLLVVKLLGRLN
jgi:adenosylhomocysteine nucleosidase